MAKKTPTGARSVGSRGPRPRALAQDVGSRNRPAYNFAAVEKKWRARWEEGGIYRPDLQTARRPYLNLMMFPYPSAEGLHVGNMYSYVGSDVHGRWKAMQGFDVFEPIGFDAFGIHSENFALKQGIHPRMLTARNIEHFRRQLASIGNRFDWSHEVVTTDPRYYRWSQWIFIQLFRAGLAERKLAAVNWCPNDKTVLADEQVIAGRCERCGAAVERRELEQWFFKITRYADRLLDNLAGLDWTERVKALQRNWIGCSRGLALDFGIAGSSEKVRVYTTRPDTIFGVTFIALAPGHPLIETITRAERAADVKAYVKRARQVRRAGTVAHAEAAVSGVFTGAFVVHPMTGARVPVWVSDAVLAEYGTGAIMGVPAHDARDLAFARTMGLPLRFVVRPPEQESAYAAGDDAVTGPGVLVDSGDFTGMSSAQADEAISHWCEAHGVGERTVRFHLRDWLISRQRYWGPPIPIIYCPDHGAVAVPETELPVLLPETEEFAPRGTGSSPLAAIEGFVQTTCPICGVPARRETDVSDNFVDSAWYYLRYPSTGDDSQPWDPRLTRMWLPPAMYIGGAEHSVLHLMYARFITMALHDLGLLDFEEPFPHFRANGMITKDGAKISKSRGNSVNPDVYIARYGADVFRTYLLLWGPMRQAVTSAMPASAASCAS
jgi:leucyl-tRNA synthetase